MRPERVAGGARDPERVLFEVRNSVLVFLAGPVLLLGAAASVGAEELIPALATPVALAGIVCPVVGYRIYERFRIRASGASDERTRLQAFRKATLVALGVSSGVAAACALAFFVTGDPRTWLGLALHAILTGALWPSRRRLESFLESSET